MILILSADEKKDYDWACKVMLSCVTLEQIRNAYGLINLFYRKHKNLTLSSALIGLSVEVEQKIELELI
jgi:hypothetical protein